MITGNIVGDRVVPQTRGSFFKVADSIKDYAELMDPLCRNSDGKGGSDHFMSVIRSVDALWKKYEYIGIDNAFETIKRTPSLLSWFSMTAVIMIYGASNDDLIAPVKVEVNDSLPFLRVWKNKIETTDRLDNTLEGEEYEENILNVYSFDGKQGYSIAGCCSRRYFIIPSREIKLSEGESCPWKELFIKLTSFPDDTLKNLFVRTSLLQRLLLTLSSKSLPDNSPLKMIKDIIYTYSAPLADDLGELPAIKVGDMLIYKVNNGVVPTSMYSDKISFIYSEDCLAALYPFESSIVDRIDAGDCIVSNMTMTVRESAVIHKRGTYAARIDYATVTATFIWKLTFEGLNRRKVTVPFKFSETHNFTSRAINCLSNLSTFCMYPDIDFEYEDACRSYTYFSNVNSQLCSSALSEESAERRSAVIDMAPCGLDAFGDLFKNASQIPDVSREDDPEEIFEQSAIKLKTAKTSKPSHLIRVSKGKQYLGVVVNLKRQSGGRCGAMLRLDETANIDCTKKTAERSGEMSAFIDLGALNCSVGYRIDEGKPYFKGVSGGTPTVRPLLAQYDIENYDALLNIADSETSSSGFMTPELASYINHISGIEDLTPYSSAFLPFSSDVGKYVGAGLKYYTMDKRKLEKQRRTSSASKSGDLSSLRCAQGVIYNLCYWAAAHAVNKGCDRLCIYPAVSGEGLGDAVKGLVTSCVEGLKQSFDLTVANMAENQDSYLLYDGLVLAVPQLLKNQRTMTINVEIGHSFTKLCGVYCDEAGRLSLRTYSLLPFGGRELLQKSVYDTLKNAGSRQLAQKVLYSQTGYDTIFTSDEESNLPALEADSKELIRRFYPNRKRRGRPRDDKWQSALGKLNSECVLAGKSSDRPVMEAFRSGLMFRYAMLMPTLLAFVKKTVDICGTSSTIKLCFTGGAAKGFSECDSYLGSESAFTDKIRQYFNGQFPGVKMIYSFGGDGDLVESLSQIKTMGSKLYNSSATIADKLSRDGLITDAPGGNVAFDELKTACLEVADELSADDTMKKLVSSVLAEDGGEQTTQGLLPEGCELYSELVKPVLNMLLADRLLSDRYHKVQL